MLSTLRVRAIQLFRGDGLRAQIMRGGLGSLLIKAGQAVLAFAVAVVLARILGPEGYGVYSYALALLMLTAIPAQVGIPQLIVRETAKAQARKDWALMRGLWRWGNGAVALLSTLGIIILWGTLVVAEGTEGGRVVTALSGIALIPMVALANVRGATLRGLRRVVWGLLPETIFRPALLLGLVLGWTILSSDNNSIAPGRVMVLHVWAAVTTFVLGGAMLWLARPKGVKEKPIPRYETRAWARAVVPLAMITGLQLINNYADLIILGIFRPDEEVGIYRAVSQVALLSFFGFQAMNSVLQPHFSRISAVGNGDKDVKRLVSLSFRLVLLLSCPFALLYFFFGQDILRIIFGSSYVAGYLSLVILSIGLIFKSLYGVMATAMNMAGHEMKVLSVAGLSVALNIVLNLITIPVFGMEGAGASTAVSFVFLGIFIYFKAQNIIFKGAC